MSLVSRRVVAVAVAGCLTLSVAGCGSDGKNRRKNRDSGSRPGAAAPANQPTPTNAALAEVDPCTLLTAADAAPYVPGDFHQNRFGTSGGLSARGQQCTYLAYADALDSAEVAVLVSQDPWTAADLKKRVDRWVRGPQDAIEPVPGVGDEAYLAVSKEFGEGWVRIGNRAFAVHVTDKAGTFLKEPTLKLTKLAATRFPRVNAGGAG